MKRKEAMKLVRALRSGKYKQTDGVLERLGADGDVKGNCCLGVACRIAGIKARPEIDIIGKAPVTVFGRSEIYELPATVKKAFGFYHTEGSRRDGEWLEFRAGVFHTLAAANDAGVTFAEIADYIEKHYEAL